MTIHKVHSKGTTKYIYYSPDTFSLRRCVLRIYKINISFPYMLSEGNSCMYGGLYIVRSKSSEDSEILSLCNSIDVRGRARNGELNYIIISDLKNVSVVIILYSEYSTESVEFIARYRPEDQRVDFDQKYKEEILSITVPKVKEHVYGDIDSYQLKLRKIQYINISCDSLVESYVYYDHPCMNVTIFYLPHASNIRGRQYDQETIYLSGYRSSFYKIDHIQSIFINLCDCKLVVVPVWSIHIAFYPQSGSKYGPDVNR